MLHTPLLANLVQYRFGLALVLFRHPLGYVLRGGAFSVYQVMRTVGKWLPRQSFETSHLTL